VKFGHARLHEAHEPRETIDRQHRLLLAGPDALHITFPAAGKRYVEDSWLGDLDSNQD
jgi:hypothetical protein